MSDDNNSHPDDVSTAKVLELYGCVMFRTQILESDMQIVLTVLEKAGIVQIDREEYKVRQDKYGVIEACIGPMIYWLQEHSTIDIPKGMAEDLIKANRQRIHLAHTFLIRNSCNFRTRRGRLLLYQKLLMIQAHIIRVSNGIIHVRNELYSQQGLTEDIMQARLEKHIKRIEQSDRQ